MNLFNIITLFGGLAMFLYGMRMMGDGLKASSSGTLKKAMERITGTPIKAFLLGLIVTAVIQSSTATIVLTSGLVGAGIISLHQSLGIIIGANVGTTITGQIIRLLDINSSGTWFLQLLKPSTLAPLALIIGIIIIMGMKSRDSVKIGHIIIGFGILFSGLMNMSDAVSVLSDSGIVENATIPSIEYRNNFQKDHLVSPATRSTFSYSSHFVSNPTQPNKPLEKRLYSPISRSASTKARFIRR